MNPRDRLTTIKYTLEILENRAVALTQQCEDTSAPYFNRAEAVLALDTLNRSLQTIKKLNAMAGHLSKNERLRKLQEDNKELKKQLAKYESDSEPDDDDNVDQSTDVPFDILEGTNKEVGEAVNEIDDVETLKALLDEELGGENRKGAVGHIDRRISELTDDAEG